MKKVRSNNVNNIKYMDAICVKLAEMMKEGEYKELHFCIKFADGVIQSASIKPFAKGDAIRIEI